MSRSSKVMIRYARYRMMPLDYSWVIQLSHICNRGGVICGTRTEFSRFESSLRLDNPG